MQVRADWDYCTLSVQLVAKSVQYAATR